MNIINDTTGLLFTLGHAAAMADKPCTWDHLPEQEAVVLEIGYRCGQIARAGRHRFLRRLAAAADNGTLHELYDQLRQEMAR